MAHHSKSLLLALVAAAGLAFSAAPASAKLTVGISENNPHFFNDQFFKPLGIKHARMVVPWNVLQRKDYWPAYLQLWLDNAKANGVEPHIAFNIIDYTPKYYGKGPTLGQYRKLIQGFRKKYPTVKSFTPWNEANHSFQPTARKPKLAWQYYLELKRVCPTCKTLVADVLDDASMVTWVRKFRRYYKGTGTWGIHNYQDGKSRSPIGKSETLRITKLVPGKIWSTEAGGIVGFRTVKGRLALKFNPKRALRDQQHLFKLMRDRKVRRRYERVYIHHYFGTWTKTKEVERWDSGILGANLKPRPAYYDLKKQVKRG